MTAKDIQYSNDWEKGRRAEEVGVFYLRLNGFFTIPNFAIHRDSVHHHLRTEADVVGVRFPFGMEHSNGERMRDDPVIVDLAAKKRLFALVEIKSGLCEINGPWKIEEGGAENLAYVIKRMGLARVRQIAPIADSLARNFTWEDEENKVVYLCIGDRPNPKVRARQILFKEVAAFLRRRFSSHPLKLPNDVGSLRMWGEFGYELAQWCQKHVIPLQAEQPSTDEALQNAIERYIAGISMELPDSRPSW